MVMLERPAELDAALLDLAARAGSPDGDRSEGPTDRIEVPSPR
jgi:hypothetical protein